LAASIGKYDLIQPIVVDAKKNLVAGGRRLRACTQLGWTEIPARLYADLTENERAEIELEENKQRLNLSPEELSKQIIYQAKNTTALLSSETEDKKPRGHKRTYDVPKKDIADALGIGVATLVAAEQHITATERYPVLTQIGALSPKQATTIAKNLDLLPVKARNEQIDLLAAFDPATTATRAAPCAVRAPKHTRPCAVGRTANKGPCQV
jgi:nitrogen fixation protein